VLDIRGNHLGKQGTRIMMRKIIVRSKPQSEWTQAAGSLIKGVGNSAKTVAGGKGGKGGGNDDPTHSKLHVVSGLPVRRMWRATELVKRARLAALARGHFAAVTEVASIVCACFDGPETKAAKRKTAKMRKQANSSSRVQQHAMTKSKDQREQLKEVVDSGGGARRNSLWQMASKRNSLVDSFAAGLTKRTSKPKRETKAENQSRLMGAGGNQSLSILHSPLKQHTDWISELRLTNCNLEDVEVELLAAFTKDLELRVLDLRGNPYGFESAISMLHALGRKETVKDVTGRDLFIRFEGDHDTYGKYYPTLEHDPYFRKTNNPTVQGDVFLDSATFDLEYNLVLEELCGIPVRQMRENKVTKLDLSGCKKGMELGEGGAVFAAKVLQIHGKVITQVNMAEAFLGGIVDVEPERKVNHGDDDGAPRDPRQDHRMNENKAAKAAAAAAGRSSRGLLMLGHLLIQWPWGELRTANIRDNYISDRAKANLMMHQKQQKVMKKDGADGDSTEYLIRI
jgi:hypothetical protein